MQPSAADTDAPLGPQRTGLLLTVAGAVGLLAAGALLIEKVRVLEDPAYVPTCSFNPILSCGSVMTSSQAEAFGFPNPVLGIAGFAIVLTSGVVVLAGAELRRWYWLGLQAGVTFGIAFVHWLIFQSLYRIGALCPYCMVVWAVTIPLFVGTTAHNVRNGNLPGATRARDLAAYGGVVVTAWFLVIAGLIARRFWDYWQTLLP